MRIKNCLECHQDFTPHAPNQKYCIGCGSYNFKLKQRRQRHYKVSNGLCEKCGKPRNGTKYRCASCKLDHQARGWKALGIQGATKELYEQLLATQTGKCAICGQAQTRRMLALDHNHTTGIPRKLLCDGCNAAVGAAEKLVDLFGSLERLGEYLTLDSRQLLENKGVKA